MFDLFETEGKMTLEHVSSKHKTGEGTNPTVLVCPLPTSIPADGTLDYVVFEAGVHFKTGLGCDKAVTVICFDKADYEYLQVIVEHVTLFEVELKQIQGVPESTYDAEFNTLVWNLGRVSYSALILNVSEEEAIMRSKNSGEAGSFEKETEQYTNKKGDIKVHKATLDAAIIEED